MFVAKSPSESPCARSGFPFRFPAARKTSRGFVLVLLSNLRQQILIVPTGFSRVSCSMQVSTGVCAGFVVRSPSPTSCLFRWVHSRFPAARNCPRGFARGLLSDPRPHLPVCSLGALSVSCSTRTSTGICAGYSQIPARRNGDLGNHGATTGQPRGNRGVLRDSCVVTAGNRWKLRGSCGTAAGICETAAGICETAAGNLRGAR